MLSSTASAPAAFAHGSDIWGGGESCHTNHGQSDDTYK